MYQLYILALVGVVGFAKGAVPSDCCKEKTVGDKSYYLAGMEDTSMYNCLAPCVYKLEGDDEGKMFCFAAGDLEVVCGDGGEFTEKPAGSEGGNGGPSVAPEEGNGGQSVAPEGGNGGEPEGGNEGGECTYPEGHTMNLYSGPAAECGWELMFSGLDQATKDQIVKKHNELRQKVASGGESGQPSASNMRKFVWNDELAKIAQRWTGQCKFEHDELRNLCDGTLVGQNAFIAQTDYEEYEEEVSIEASVQAWYNEVTNPGFSSSNINPFVFGDGWGHYSQVAWAETYQVGCGRVYYVTEDSWYSNLVICNYAVAGNLQGGVMYEEGDKCSNCPAGTTCDATFDALCA
eukprot:TRINITY_DN7246_c0_g1_i3.p1 TRINITY_DN7246_c0_g1~~TRINITY_DN7246_c0_g1_i3.p1  ORF type:complete len:356 (+),score=76.87 TRINITY_DN7246_c0_g1_i3:30-1070(+)